MPEFDLKALLADLFEEAEDVIVVIDPANPLLPVILETSCCSQSYSSYGSTD